MDTSVNFEICGPSSSKATFTCTSSESDSEVHEFKEMFSFGNLFIDEGTSETKVKIKKKRKKHRKPKTSKGNEGRNLDIVKNEDQDLLKTFRDEDLIEEVFHEVTHFNNLHTMPKIKFNFSRLLPQTKNENCVVNKPEFIAEEQVSTNFCTKKVNISTEKNGKNQKIKKEKKGKPVKAQDSQMTGSLLNFMIKNKNSVSTTKKKFEKSVLVEKNEVQKTKTKKEEGGKQKDAQSTQISGISLGSRPSTKTNANATTTKQTKSVRIEQNEKNKNPKQEKTKKLTKSPDLHTNISPVHVTVKNDSIAAVKEKKKNGVSIEQNEENKKPKQEKTKKLTKSPGLHTNISPVHVTVNDSIAAVKEKKKNEKKKKSKVLDYFEDYLTEDEIAQGLSAGLMLAGLLRINQRNYREAYISAKDDKDILIEGVKDRNRAMEGDEVVVLIKPRKEWKGGPSGQKTAKVVKITQYNHQRTCVGQLNLPDEITNINFYIFSPRDSRIPRLRISKDDIPEEVKLQREVCRNYIWHVRIDEWVDISFADGTILQLLGISGDIECETAALMLELGLDLKPIPKELDVYYPQVPFSIPEEELNTRTDLRNECIFTIDPATAKDLDDAVSCKVLPNGNFEVGVHISDVTYFLQEGTPLDTVVSKRATTVYLVQRQYHMLPLDLCSICSLTPGVDKLAFSVIFEITPDAEVVSRRFCRSVINSCSQFAYEHAQFIIENPDMELNCEDFPKVSNGFGPNDCATCVKYLYKLSLIMRNRRYSTGALRLDVPKLYFSLDPETHRPTSCFLYEVKDSHRLIEEFMLLANMAVAEHIYQVYPNLAFLRNHGPPILHLITELQEKLSRIGININITSAGNLHSSLSQYLPKHPANHFDWLRSAVLYNLCSRPMKRALYFIPNPDMDKEDFYHYALNSRFYTHFTSPIRRYADIMVHRLLAAAIGCRPKPLWTEDYSQTVARTCNMKKYNAKLAGDRSSLLYLALYLEDHGPIVTHAGVFDVRANSFDCIVYSLGILLRIYLNQCNAEVYFTVENGMSTLEVIWDENLKQTIQILSIVNVQISKHNGLVKVNGILLPPAVV